MMKIGQFTDTFLPVIDGVGRVALAYAETLCKRGHEVTVIAPDYDTGHRGGYPFELVDYVSHSVPIARQYRTGTPTLDNHYKRRIDRVQLDLVHAHSPFTAGKEALRIAKERSLPLVATFHSKYYDDFMKYTRSEALSKVALMNVVSFYHRCDEVWAVSDTTADVLRDYGYNGRIVTMPNGVNLRTVKPQAVEAVNAEYDFAPDQPLLLFVGQMDYKKNIRTLLDAMALLKAWDKPARLILGGQGPDEKDIAQVILQLSLEDRVTMIGHVKDMEKLDALYARADLFVFPSVYDNAPMVVREAAVMGTPSLLIRGSSAAEVVEDGVNGLLCEDDPESLAMTIVRALNNPDNLVAWGDKARDTIPVSWDTVADMMTDRYRRLITVYKGIKRRRRSSRLMSNDFGDI